MTPEREAEIRQEVSDLYKLELASGATAPTHYTQLMFDLIQGQDCRQFEIDRLREEAKHDAEALKSQSEILGAMQASHARLVDAAREGMEWIQYYSDHLGDCIGDGKHCSCSYQPTIDALRAALKEEA